jgi:hypothetical protein
VSFSLAFVASVRSAADGSCAGDEFLADGPEAEIGAPGEGQWQLPLDTPWHERELSERGETRVREWVAWEVMYFWVTWARRGNEEWVLLMDHLFGELDQLRWHFFLPILGYGHPINSLKRGVLSPV